MLVVSGSLLVVCWPSNSLTRADLLPSWRGAGEGEREGFLFPFEQERLRPLPVPPVALDLLPLSLTAKVILVCLAVHVGAWLRAGCVVGSSTGGGGGGQLAFLTASFMPVSKTLPALHWLATSRGVMTL